MKKIALISLCFILIDQLSKYLIITCLSVGSYINVIDNFFRIAYVKNVGAAFSLLEGKTIFLILFTLLVLFLGVFFLRKKTDYKKLDILIYSLIIGGIIGNLIDRIIYGYVIDFISFNFYNYYFPIFNLADSFIVIGCAIYIIKLIKEEQHARI